jgi:hypothetical protein
MLVYSALVKMCVKKRDSICQVARSRKDLPSRADRSPFLSGDLRAAATNTLSHLTSIHIPSKGDLPFVILAKITSRATSKLMVVASTCKISPCSWIRRGVAGNATITPYHPSAGFPPGILGTARLRIFFFQPTDPRSPARGQDQLLGW